MFWGYGGRRRGTGSVESIGQVGGLVLARGCYFQKLANPLLLWDEQFWGRAARASGDSRESGRPLNFGASLGWKFRILTSADIFPSTRSCPKCGSPWLVPIPAYLRRV